MWIGVSGIISAGFYVVQQLDWIHLAQDSAQLWALMNMVVNLWVSKMQGI
jgi:hypothetical protein